MADLKLKGDQAPGRIPLDREAYARVVRALTAMSGVDPSVVKIPTLKLDETVAFQGLLVDATQPPFRKIGQQFRCGFKVAGQTMLYTIPAIENQDPGVSATIIDRIEFDYATTEVEIGLGVADGGLGGALSPSADQPVNVEEYTANPGLNAQGAYKRTTRSMVTGGVYALVDPTGGTDFDVLVRVPVPTMSAEAYNPMRGYDLGVVLWPGMQLLLHSVSGADSVSWVVNVYGRVVPFLGVTQVVP